MIVEPIDDDDALVARACAADPLAADVACARVPAMNAAADVRALTGLLHEWAPALPSMLARPLPDAVAAVRDVGLVLGSLRRHGVEAAEVAPAVVAPLVALGARTAMIPRDTIFHYTLYNPRGPRQRMYTGQAPEGDLIESVRMVLPGLGAGLARCAELMMLPVGKLAPGLRDLAAHLRPLVDSMALVRERVPPAFFTHELRPYLDDVRLDGASYFGPAAAQLPLWLFDVALWGAREPAYEAFWRALVPYALPAWRGLLEMWAGRPSLAERVGEALQAPPADAPLAAAGAALLEAIEVLVRFRGRHLGIARKAYAVSTTYAVGSGGGSVELLKQILDLTRETSAKEAVRGGGAGSES